MNAYTYVCVCVCVIDDMGNSYYLIISELYILHYLGKNTDQ